MSGRVTNVSCCCFRQMSLLMKGVHIGSVCDKVTKLSNISHVDTNKCHALVPIKWSASSHIIDFEKKRNLVIVTCETIIYFHIWRHQIIHGWKQSIVTKIVSETERRNTFLCWCTYETFFSVFSLMVCIYTDICGKPSDVLQKVVSSILHFDANIGEKLQMWCIWFTCLTEYYTVTYKCFLDCDTT